MKKNLLIFLLVTGVCLLRLIHIEADSPGGLGEKSAGLYVDEGYKTLDARNIVLFGTAHWHPLDSYSGWSERSPITQFSYLLAFKSFGANLAAARAVTIVYFLVFLLSFLWAHWKREPQQYLIAGILLLGVSYPIFFFSRVALFEFPITALTYGLVFSARALVQPRISTIIALSFAVLGIITFGIKASGPLYVMPVMGGFLVAFLLQQRRISSRTLGWLLLPTIALSSALLYATRTVWMGRVSVNFVDWITGVIGNPMWRHAWGLSLLGLVCALFAMLSCGRRFFADPYRGALLGLVVLGPALLGLFSYHPFRYYIPFCPAYILLALEWFARSECREAAGKISATLQRSIVLAIAALMLTKDFYLVGGFMIDPTYQARDFTRLLQARVPHGSVVAGDWAPFFTLGTDLKALYAAEGGANPASRLTQMRPEYLITVTTKTSSEVVESLGDYGVTLGVPILTGEYARRFIELKPITWPVTESVNYE